MRKIIRLNDPTDHGGQVIQVAATHIKVGGIPVARVGDRCSCPKKGHDNCVIVEGEPGHTIDGIAVAYEGHQTSCGARLIATVQNFGRG